MTSLAGIAVECEGLPDKARPAVCQCRNEAGPALPTFACGRGRAEWGTKWIAM